MNDVINYKLVGIRISDWRKRLNITQDDLSFLTGISHCTVRTDPYRRSRYLEHKAVEPDKNELARRF